MKEILTSQLFSREERGSRHLTTLCLIRGYGDFHSLERYLHINEQKRYNKFPALIRKNSYILGRYCAKRALSQIYPEISASEIEIDRGVFYYPIIRHPKVQNTQVSITHTECAAAAIVFKDDHPVGIDIEIVNSGKSKTIQKQLSERENTLQGDMEKAEFNTILWTSKESLSKALKIGMMASPMLYEIEDITRLSIHAYETTFKYFFQYKAVSYKFDDLILTLCYPKKSQIESPLV